MPTRASLVYKLAFRLPALRLPSPGSHCMTPSSCRLLLLSSCTPNKVAQSFLSSTSFHHHASLLRPPPLIAFLACAHFQYWLQHYPQCDSCLPSPYVGHFRLCSRCFPYCFRPGRLLCPVWKPPRPLPHDLPKKTCVCPLCLPFHCRQK